MGDADPVKSTGLGIGVAAVSMLAIVRLSRRCWFWRTSHTYRRSGMTWY